MLPGSGGHFLLTAPIGRFRLLKFIMPQEKSFFKVSPDRRCSNWFLPDRHNRLLWGYTFCNFDQITFWQRRREAKENFLGIGLPDQHAVFRRIGCLIKIARALADRYRLWFQTLLNHKKAGRIRPLRADKIDGLTSFVVIIPEHKSARLLGLGFRIPVRQPGWRKFNNRRFIRGGPNKAVLNKAAVLLAYPVKEGGPGIDVYGEPEGAGQKNRDKKQAAR